MLLSSSSTPTTSLALQRLPTRMARQRCLFSSMTLRIFSLTHWWSHRTGRPWPSLGAAGSRRFDAVLSRQPSASPFIFSGWAAAAPPRAKAGVRACGSPSRLPAATGRRSSAVPNECGQRRSRGDAAAASPSHGDHLRQMALCAAVINHHWAAPSIGCP